jgi:hypothetical protein
MKIQLFSRTDHHDLIPRAGSYFASLQDYVELAGREEDSWQLNRMASIPPGLIKTGIFCRLQTFLRYQSEDLFGSSSPQNCYEGDLPLYSLNK